MKIGQPDDEHPICVGMHRPLLRSLNERAAGHYRCPCVCGVGPSTTEGMYVHWSRGHFDQPVYCSLAELVAAGWQPQAVPPGR